MHCGTADVQAHGDRHVHAVKTMPNFPPTGEVRLDRYDLAADLAHSLVPWHMPGLRACANRRAFRPYRSQEL